MRAVRRGRRLMAPLVAVALCGGAAGCSYKRPVLYPSAQLSRAGPEFGQRAIDDCLELADDAGLDRSVAGDAARSSATGAATGAASGAAGGAVVGRPGRGAAAGAAAGATGGFLRAMFRTRDHPPAYKNYVEICLRHQGYDVLDWK